MLSSGIAYYYAPYYVPYFKTSVSSSNSTDFRFIMSADVFLSTKCFVCLRFHIDLETFPMTCNSHSE